LLGDEGRTPEAVQFSERAIGIHEALSMQDPGNREYKMELAQWCSVMANLLVDENRLDLAKQRNQQALALFNELAKPATSLRFELDQAQKLHDYLQY
jgi:hypothetical protein